ncbi:hypothetical protein AB0N05_07730 [Nocardia sp. NPDC051030]|uniref:hypothetical protein n=1 Tax=Nocardia sp. NPDC051030 TaxID=3155162 RepID=UPI00342C8E75
MRRTGWIVVAGGLLAAGMTASGLAVAEPDSSLAMIDCSDSYRTGQFLEISCYNPDSAAGTVDLFYACSTPLDFDHQVIFNEPGFSIGPGSTLRLHRDCGAEQVVITFQASGLTASQQDDQNTRLDQLREKRDRAAGR